jgi:TIR domain
VGLLASDDGEPMSDVFISYARQDQMLAKELAHHLQPLGFQVWWDTELLEIG